MVELLEGLDRGQALLVLAGKAGEVEDHPRGQGRQHRAHLVPVGRREGFEAGERLGKALEQLALRDAVLMGRAGARHRRDVGRLAAARPAHGFEVGQPVLARHQLGVGDGVGRAREQVGQANRLAQGGREDGEGKVEAPADLPQEVAQQVAAHATRGRTVAWAARDRPWPA